MPIIIPSVGDYVKFQHPTKGATVGRVTQQFIYLNQYRLIVRYWFDAFSGYDTIEISASSARIMEDTAGYDIPLSEIEKGRITK